MKPSLPGVKTETPGSVVFKHRSPLPASFTLAGLLFAITLAGFAQTNLTNEVSRLEAQGQFKEAEKLLAKGISEAKSSPAALKKREFEADRLGRINKDY